jgi:hypothetical protein
MPAQDLIAGSLSGFVSCVLLQPLEVIKTRLQQQTMALHFPSLAVPNIAAPATFHPSSTSLTSVPFEK